MGLLVAFGGITDRLIPLFAVGAFLSFTLSQAGMAAHWRRRMHALAEPRGSSGAGYLKLFINSLGAAATGAALAVILAAKFIEGAWLTVIVIPCIIVLLRAVRRYYDEIDKEVLQGSERQIDLRRHGPPVILVPLKQWDRLARKAIEYAMRISPEVTALHLTNLDGPDAEDKLKELRNEWHDFVRVPAQRAGLNPPSLQFVPSEFRSMAAPLLRAIKDARERHPNRPITVLLPELVEGRWWGYLMHTSRERRLRAKLLRHGGPDVIVSSVPWQLQPADLDKAISEEETGLTSTAVGEAGHQ
jgi:hypothetical protein